jgi:hypothetical protein
LEKYIEKYFKTDFAVILQVCYIAVALKKEFVLSWIQQVKDINWKCCCYLKDIKVRYLFGKHFIYIRIWDLFCWGDISTQKCLTNGMMLFNGQSTTTDLKLFWICIIEKGVIVFFTTFNNISVIWQSVLLVEETGIHGENHQPAICHWQTLSHNDI